jgi:hypothetical protein
VLLLLGVSGGPLCGLELPRMASANMRVANSRNCTTVGIGTVPALVPNARHLGFVAWQVLLKWTKQKPRTVKLRNGVVREDVEPKKNPASRGREGGVFLRQGDSRLGAKVPARPRLIPPSPTPVGISHAVCRLSSAFRPSDHPLPDRPPRRCRYD